MSLISRLSKLDIPNSDGARTELANVIHRSLRDAESELELLSAQVEDEVGDGAQVALKSKVEKAGEDLKMFVLHTHSPIEAWKPGGGEEANVLGRAAHDCNTAKPNSPQSVTHLPLSNENGRLCWAGRAAAPRTAPPGSGRGIRSYRNASSPLSFFPKDGAKEKVEHSQNDLLLHSSTDVTTALRRTHTLLQSELSRSQFAAETLNSSTAALQDLNHRYSAFDDVISSSRALISDLVRKNKSDKWYYEKAIQILLVLLVWLVIRRLLWGPIYLFLVVPFRVTWWGLSLVAGGLGVGGGREIREGAGVGTGGATTAQVVGIPESMLEKKSPEGRATLAPGEGEKSVREQVEAIIDGELELEVEKVEMEKAEPVDRNPKARSMEYDLEEERQAREKGRPEAHDEL